MDMDFAAINEARRRRMGQEPSGAGMPGGMPQSNTPMASNPIAAAGQTSNTPPSPTGGQPANASEGGIKAMNNALPGEANMILKALIKQLDRLTGGDKPQM